MIDFFSPIEAAMPDGVVLGVRRDHRCWPNQVSGEYCAHIQLPGDDRETEHWYDEDGTPTDVDSPAIRNARAPIQKERLKAAYLAGCGNPADGDARFETWFADSAETLLDIEA